MPTIAELVERSGDLKQELVKFGQQRRFAKELDGFMDETLGRKRVRREAELVNTLDFFLLQHHLPDGSTVVEQFVSEHPALPRAEREMLLGWRDVVEGIFELRRHDGDALVVLNLIDELFYRVHSNMGPGFLDRVQRGTFLVGRLVPVGEDWLLSGTMSSYPPASRQAMRQAAAETALQRPALAFRNPQKLEQGWELQRRERASFIAFFGSDLIVLPGHEVQQRMRDQMHFLVYEERDERGKSMADLVREAHETMPPLPELPLSSELTEAESVGVIYDEVDGLNFFPDFGLVEESFATPELLVDRRHREAVLDYLDEPGFSPLPIRRLADPDPGRASRVFQILLKHPGFSWERDGEALLRARKASWFELPPLPSVVPVSGTLAEAQAAAGLDRVREGLSSRQARRGRRRGRRR